MRVVLPYSDPRRRRKVRSLSQALVTCLLWPGEQASSTDIAQLALVRLLWLQREAHRSVHAGLSESAALLTRTAIETCIVGLYCLVTPDAPTLLSNQNAYQLRAMLRYLPECVFTQRAQGRVVDVAGTPTTKPSILDMVEAVDKASSGGEAEMLYRAYYAPLSALYAHGGGTALLRHVDHADRVSFRPKTPWFYRSALHITDSCVALLASKIAGAVGADSAVLDRYYEAHRSRAITPVAALGGKTLPHMIRWRGVPGAVRAGRQLRAYLSSAQAVADTPAVREATIRAYAFGCFTAVAADVDMVGVFVDELVARATSDGLPAS